ncbi:hypothetical protein NKH77_49690 [Streptomyces sp. M19]
MVIRPVVDPVPVFPFSVVWRAGRSGGPLRRALTTIGEISAERDWLDLPREPWWLPRPTALSRTPVPPYAVGSAAR